MLKNEPQNDVHSLSIDKTRALKSQHKLHTLHIEVRKLYSSKILVENYEFSSIITEHSKDTASLYIHVPIKKQFLLSFSTAFWSQTGRKKQSGRKRVEKVDKNCIWSIKDKTILLECSLMLN